MREPSVTRYDATVYWDDEANENAAMDSRTVGLYRTKAEAVRAVRDALAGLGQGWNSGSVGRGEFTPGDPGIRPDHFESDDDYGSWSVGPTWCER